MLQDRIVGEDVVTRSDLVGERFRKDGRELQIENFGSDVCSAFGSDVTEEELGL